MVVRMSSLEAVSMLVLMVMVGTVLMRMVVVEVLVHLRCDCWLGIALGLCTSRKEK
jgi:hypothetical protein